MNKKTLKMSSKTINIGILAHADAGKTTITENILFLSGEIKSIGNVDKASCKTDFLEVEKERGISVKTAVIPCKWENYKINIIDTPGHIDFSSEIDRALRVLDYAILVISAVEGVQSQTKSIFDALQILNIPVIIFINKIDRIGADSEIVIKEIKKELSAEIIICQEIENEGNENVKILQNTKYSENFIEKIAEKDENILEKYLENQEIQNEELEKVFYKNFSNSTLYPIYFGSGKLQIGIEQILNFITLSFSETKNQIDNCFSALVFRIDHDKILGKVAGIRIFSGEIKPRDIIFNSTKNQEQKIALIKEFYANKFNDLQQASQGEIVAISGIQDIDIGDILGDISKVKEKISINNPLMIVRVFPEKESDFSALTNALNELSQEDPALEFVHDKELQELNIKITGKIQIEILKKILSDRFKINAQFENPTVIYKETPKKSGEGFVRYWMPKPCWAIMKFKIEPAERGSGIKYKSEISVNDVLQKYQNEVERTIPAALKQGIKGWEVTDIKITLIEGEDHNVHSRPGDFVVATPMGIMNGLVNTDTEFIEPIISFQVKAPERLLGAVAGEIHKMRGTFESPEIQEDIFIMKGKVPVATSMDFPIFLASLSEGKAKFSSKFFGYEICPENEGITREYRGISPLDEAKWILKARKALQ